MNADNIRYVAKQILDHKDTFNMSNSFNACGTPACIAGFCATSMGMGREDYFRNIGKPGKMITDYFGIDIYVGTPNSIYAPVNDHAYWNAREGQPKFITPEHAASMLYHLADTGKVDWSVKNYTPTKEFAKKLEEEMREWLESQQVPA